MSLLAHSPANFRVMRVAAIRDLNPRMRRITFAGTDLARFDTFDQLHVQLFIPPRGRQPVWPRVGGNGGIEWPDGDEQLIARKYTIRRLDVAAGMLEVDFVLHGDAGPGTAFARAATAGDVIGLMGPGGLSVRPADWYLLAGDETALPAIARIVENLPPSAKAVVRLEVTDRSDEQVLDSAASLDVAWLHRGATGQGSGERLVDAVRAVSWPDDGGRVFAWIGCEHSAFRAIRTHLRREKGVSKEDHLAVAYWRADEAYAETVALPADAARRI